MFRFVSLRTRSSAVAAIAGLSLAGLGVVSPPVHAEPAASAKPANVTDRPDRVSAMVAARSQGSRVEDLSARTPSTATFANPDGTWTTEAYPGMVRSKIDDDQWVAVDAGVVRRGARFEQAATPADGSFSTGDDKQLGSLRTADGAKISMGWPSDLPVPTTSDDELTYANAAHDGSDLVVSSLSDGFESSIVLDKAPGAGDQATYRIPLHIGDLDPTLRADGAVILRDPKHKAPNGSTIAAVVGAPVMWDAANAGADGTHLPITTVLEGTGADRTLVLSPDMDFLTDPATVYPVTLDPTVTVNVAGDTWVASGLSATVNSDTSAELRVGSNTLGVTTNRSLIQLDPTAFGAIPAFDHVVSASLTLSNFVTGSCSGTAIRLSRITSTWTSSAVTWNTQPTTTSDGSTTSTDSHGGGTCAAEAPVAFDATAIAQAWADGAPVDGLELSADNPGAITGWRKYRSLENGTPGRIPVFSMTYDANPNTPANLTTTPGYTGYVSSKTPTLTATVTDPDGGAVAGYFEVKNSSGTTVWSGTSSSTTSGGQVSIAVPSGTLTEGATYTVRAWADDGTLRSTAATAAKTFIVDTTAPTVSISASGYTNGTWNAGAPTAATFTYDGSSDVGGFYITYDGYDFPAVGANSSGDASFPFTPAAGWHTLSVVAVDKAGNRSTPTVFTFGAGDPSFQSPNEWAGGTSSFPITASGPPSSTGASLSWRYFTESTWRSAAQATNAGSAWTGGVTSSGGRSYTPDLVWNATSETVGTGTLTGPALVQIRVCFHYTSASDACTAARYVSLVGSALDGNGPQADLGPATVALSTGEAQIFETDAADSTAGVGRTFRSFDAATTTPGLFGPGWSDPQVLALISSDASASVIDNRTVDGTFVIIDPDSGAQVFKPKTGSSTVWLPADPTGDVTSLTFAAGTGGSPDSLVLSRPLGAAATTTTWNFVASDTGGDPAWTVVSADAPGTGSDVDVRNTGQRPTWVRESDPAAATTCTAATQTSGCRGLKVTYAGTGTSTRVSEVDTIIGGTTPTTKLLATYSYTGTGAAATLASVCTAAPAVGKPTLCTSYTYTTVSGRTLIATLMPPGQTPWRFTYDAGGRMLNVKRARPTADSPSGDATWAIDYNQSLTGTSMPDMSAGTIAQWGQSVVPTKVYAVCSPTNGAPDVTNADLYYTAADGHVTNTATYSPQAGASGSSGWLLDTTWLDATGNEVQHLDPTGYARVQAAPTADRPAVAAEASSYEVYNTWGDPGTRLLDEYGPAHTSTIANGPAKGTVGMFRTHTHTIYDDDPSVDPSLLTGRPTPLSGSTGYGLAVEQVNETSDAAMATDYDPVTTKYGYAPIVAGDGNGWNLGQPTSTSVQLDASTWSTTIDRYDTGGNEIEARQPGGSADASGAGNDAHSTETSYYTATGTGDCGGKPAWAGLVCKTGPASQPPAPNMPTTYYTAYNDDQQPISIQEFSNGVVARTTTNAYDALGRQTTGTIATSGPDVRSGTITTNYGYDDSTGLATTTDNGSDVITMSYDPWGRTSDYEDASGNIAVTTYDAAGATETFNDGTGTYHYSYGSHGQITSVDTGDGGGVFAYSYTADGSLATFTYPNGLLATHGYDEIGDTTALTYTQGSTKVLAFTETIAPDGRGTGRTSTESSQTFIFDSLDRLTKAESDQEGGCTTRTYGFDASSNRSTYSSYAPTTGGGCQSSAPTVSRVDNYDSSGRITNTGYSYDGLGRTLTTPAVDAGGVGALTASFEADDMVGSLNQSIQGSGGGVVNEQIAYQFDPARRSLVQTEKANGTEVDRTRSVYADNSDTPVGLEESNDSGTNWLESRYITAPTQGMVASVLQGAETYQLTDLAGSIVAGFQVSAGQLAYYSEVDEFGNSDGQVLRYQWLGSYQRAAQPLGGMVILGARMYNPSTGLFLSPDPITGGNATKYGYPADPVNSTDLTGQGLCIWGEGWCELDVKNKYHHRVHVSERVLSEILKDHGITRDAVRYLIEHAERNKFIKTAWSGRKAYSKKIHSIRCTMRTGCHVEDHWVTMVIVVEWVNSVPDDGDLVTAYCLGWNGLCPEWIRDSVWL